MRRLATFLLLAALGLSACQGKGTTTAADNDGPLGSSRTRANSPAPEVSPSPTPLPVVSPTTGPLFVVGKTWVYRTSGHGSDPAQVVPGQETWKVLSLGEKTAELEVTTQLGAAPATTTVRPAEYLAPNPWTRVRPVFGKTASAERTESVTVPAGTYQAQRISVASSSANATYWLVDGVGLVKLEQVTQPGTSGIDLSSKITLELLEVK